MTEYGITMYDKLTYNISFLDSKVYIKEIITNTHLH